MVLEVLLAIGGTIQLGKVAKFEKKIHHHH